MSNVEIAEHLGLETGDPDNIDRHCFYPPGSTIQVAERVDEEELSVYFRHHKKFKKKLLKIGVAI